jgi:hypothetical protein
VLLYAFKQCAQHLKNRGFFYSTRKDGQHSHPYHHFPLGTHDIPRAHQ